MEAAVEAEPEPVFEDAAVAEDVTEEEPEPIFEDAKVVEEVPAPVFEDAVVVEDVIEEEPEPVFENARVVDDVTEEQPEAVFDDAVVVEASEDAEIQALTEADPQTGSAEVDDRAVRVRASTNGNGHKSRNAHEVVVEINGHEAASTEVMPGRSH